MISITKRFTFEASHRLEDKKLTKSGNQKVFGKCFNKPSHGHSYKLYVTITDYYGKHFSSPGAYGMILNFSELKKIVNKVVIDELDHKFLNDVKWLPKPPTCENMLTAMQKRIDKALPKDTEVIKLVLYETEDSCATWEKDDEEE